MMMLFYTTFPSNYGDFTIVWKKYDSNVLIQQIFFGDHKLKSEGKVAEAFQNIILKSSTTIDKQGKKIQQFLKGEEVEFDLKLLDFDRCSEIQKKVLIAEYNIPRGWVSTYKRIANHIGIVKGARVVGNSLAKNPFPIFIPCHRAIRSNGELGGYQGGLAMKRFLLEMEGVEISEEGKIISENIYY